MKTSSKLIGGVMFLAAGGLLAAGLVWSGAYNVAADEPHTAPVLALLETMRDRSIATRAQELQVPADLGEVERIRQGAGNYNAMCMACHLAPGMASTEMSRGLYPAPPDLSDHRVGAAEAFWVIKHGIKASGMPAWGESMDDVYIWNMAAFLQVLPDLDASQYQTLVDSSGGHEHGGGETVEHAHAEGTSGDHHGPASSSRAGTAAGQGKAEAAHHPHPPGVADDHHAAPKGASERPGDTITHRHADGTVESHPAPAKAQDRTEHPATGSAPATDGHDHQH